MKYLDLKEPSVLVYPMYVLCKIASIITI